MKNNSVSTKARKKIKARSLPRQQNRDCSVAHGEGIVEQILTLQPVMDPVLEQVDISCRP